MKERIVIDFKYVKCAEDKNYVIARKEKCKVEKYPTNWEELKELCEDLENDSDIDVLTDVIWAKDLSFLKAGIIGHEYGSIVAENRTPAQMWNIIKNLIGEE